MHKRNKSIDKEFQDFWVPIIFDMENGRLNLEQLKKELFDYSMLLENVPKVYCEVTGGRISKPNTDPSAVIGEFNDYLQKAVDEAIEEYKAVIVKEPTPAMTKKRLAEILEEIHIRYLSQGYSSTNFAAELLKRCEVREVGK